MKASLSVNNAEIPLNDFTQNYIANVLCAIAHSLGADSRIVTISIEQKDLHVYTESGEVEITKDFTRQMIENTIKGMLSPLKGVFWLRTITLMGKDSAKITPLSEPIDEAES